jgi:2-haloacid dehalogenase
VNNSAFIHTRASLEIGFKFAAVLTAEDIGTYKPDANNFRYMLEKAKQMPGVEKDEDVLVTANSLFHDHVPAQEIGLRSSWISRAATIGQMQGVKYDFRFTTLGDMADALIKEYEAEKLE